VGLYYLRNRFYSPYLHRFVSRDPLGFGGGDANLYAYAANSPTNVSDPMGQYAPPTSVGPGGWNDPTGMPYGRGARDSGQNPNYAGQDHETVIVLVTIFDFNEFQITNILVYTVGAALLPVVATVWNAPNTLAGLTLTIPGLVTIPEVTIANSAIQIDPHPLVAAGSALTLGNVILYGPRTSEGRGGPDDLGPHEAAHVRQGQILGPLYIPANLIGGTYSVFTTGTWHTANFMESGPMANPPRPW
jgi:hypothetical protein